MSCHAQWIPSYTVETVFFEVRIKNPVVLSFSIFAHLVIAISIIAFNVIAALIIALSVIPISVISTGVIAEIIKLCAVAVYSFPIKAPRIVLITEEKHYE